MDRLEYNVSTLKRGNISIHFNNMDGNSAITLGANVPSKHGQRFFNDLLATTTVYCDSETDDENVMKEESKTLADWQDCIRNELRRTDLRFIDFADDVREEKEQRKFVQNCMDYGGSFTVKSESSSRRYTIVFPEEPPPSGEDTPPLPYCSCRAYRYKSFDTKNESNLKGCCKHLYDVVDFAERSVEDYDWNYRVRLGTDDPWSV